MAGDRDNADLYDGSGGGDIFGEYISRPEGEKELYNDINNLGRRIAAVQKSFEHVAHPLVRELNLAQQQRVGDSIINILKKMHTEWRGHSDEFYEICDKSRSNTTSMIGFSRDFCDELLPELRKDITPSQKQELLAEYFEKSTAGEEKANAAVSAFRKLSEKVTEFHVTWEAVVSSETAVSPEDLVPLDEQATQIAKEIQEIERQISSINHEQLGSLSKISESTMVGEGIDVILTAILPTFAAHVPEYFTHTKGAVRMSDLLADLDRKREERTRAVGRNTLRRLRTALIDAVTDFRIIITNLIVLCSLWTVFRRDLQLATESMEGLLNRPEHRLFEERLEKAAGTYRSLRKVLEQYSIATQL